MNRDCLMIAMKLTEHPINKEPLFEVGPHSLQNLYRVGPPLVPLAVWLAPEAVHTQMVQLAKEEWPEAKGLSDYGVKKIIAERLEKQHGPK